MAKKIKLKKLDPEQDVRVESMQIVFWIMALPKCPV